MRASFIVVCVLVSVDIDLARGQEVDTLNGGVRGERVTVLGKSVDVYYSIPYAKPPVGNLRFKHPEPVDSWRPDVRDATMKPPSCFQNFAWYDLMNSPDRYQPSRKMNEDCLYLNIWTPANDDDNSNLAVMVWIHGGTFQMGSSNTEAFNGQYLAVENNVIVVSINYRLGPFGFTYLGPDTIPGNMGLMDQIEAFKWIRENIEKFGGNKEKITLFGESAGAFSIGYHLLSPLSDGLFNNAIMESGSPIHSIHTTYVQSKGEARSISSRLANTLNCSLESQETMYECLQEAGPMDIIKEAAMMRVFFTGVQDDNFFPEMTRDIAQSGKYKKTNILHGVTKDESSLFLLTFLNPMDKTLKTSGKPLAESDLSEKMVVTAGVMKSMEKKKALKLFYTSAQEPPRDYAQILSDLSADYSFKCPALLLSSLYSKTNDVYLYSFDHRTSNHISPPWTGVPHGSEVEFVFGMPLNRSLGFDWQDRALSREIMTYWSNFAKSGNPNTPVEPKQAWPVFQDGNQTYLSLTTDSDQAAVQHGFRRHECAFINKILPKIREIGRHVNELSSGASTKWSGFISLILFQLTALVWLLQ